MGGRLVCRYRKLFAAFGKAFWMHGTVTVYMFIAVAELSWHTFREHKQPRSVS
jgi:hypothetical protein